MFRTKINRSPRKLFFCLTVLALGAVSLWFSASFNTASAKDKSSANIVPSVDFPANAGTTGAIPDGPVGGAVCGDFGAPRNVTFTVSGVGAPLTNVGVSVTGTHSWVGDLEITLIAPDGTTTANIVKQTNGTTATACGDDSNLGGPYVFSDAAPATPTFWQAATTATGAIPVAAGTYRSSAPLTGANTLITPVFAGVANPNGTWTLRVRDGGEGDIGSITAATLTLEGTVAPSGPAKNDFDGDGKSDYAIVRNTTPLSGDDVRVNSDVTAERGAIFKQTGSEDLGINPGSNRVWYINNSGNNSAKVQPFGTGGATELFVPADYDGDDRADIAVWRSQSATGPGGAFFYVLNSSNSTVTQTDFGVVGDNPTVVGDYDGDGKADPAVFRCPAFPPGGQCTYFYKGTMNNPGGNITFVPWGNNVASDLFPNRGDFDGDGKLDFCVQRVRPETPGQGQFVLLRSSNNGVEYVNWDTSSALIVPGDYDGDGKSDFMTVRVVSTNLIWSLLTRTGNTSFTQFGKTIAGFTEFVAQSDYDGDGKTDIAVYRRDNANADNCYYYVLRSGNGMLQTYEWGSTTDTPINGWDVN